VYLVTGWKPPIYICEESAATMEESYKSFHQEEGIIVVQAINNLFEECRAYSPGTHARKEE
jgi:hypothetical protein